jgi:hypothetical protein
VSLSAPVIIQVRECIDPTTAVAVAILDTILTMMVGSGDEKTQEYQQKLISSYNHITHYVQ